MHPGASDQCQRREGKSSQFAIDKIALTDNIFSQFDSFIPCSERIVRAVTDMVLLFPEVSPSLSLSLSLLIYFSD